MGMTLDDTKSYLVGLIRELNYLLSVLDHLNITRLDAKVIVAETITTEKLAAGSITTDKISVGAVTADKITVSELSAINANLGHITAGLIETVTMIASTIIGSLIKTAETGQRIELSSTDNLLKAINDGGNTITMKSNVGSTPDIEFSAAVGDFVRFYLLPGIFSIDSTLTSTDIALASGKGINLYPAGGYSVRVPSWSSLYSNGNLQSLQDALNGIYARLDALESAPPPPGP